MSGLSPTTSATSMRGCRERYLEAKDFLLANMYEEEIGGDRHTDLLIRFAEACGTTRERVKDPDNMTATTRGLQSWCYAVAMREDPIVAVAGLVVGLESQVPSIYRKQTPTLREKYKFTDEEVEFFDLHIVSDEIHGERGYQIVLEHANTVGTAAALPEDLRGRRADAAALHHRALSGLRREGDSAVRTRTRSRARSPTTSARSCRRDGRVRSCDADRRLSQRMARSIRARSRRTPISSCGPASAISLPDIFATDAEWASAANAPAASSRAPSSSRSRTGRRRSVWDPGLARVIASPVNCG